MGELGRYEFKYYKTKKGESYFGNQSGKEYYKTLGYKQVVIYFGSSVNSYRKTSELYNYLTKQKNFRLSHKSIENQVISEATEIKKAMKCTIDSMDENYNDQLEEPKCFKGIEQKLYENQYKQMVEESPESIRELIKDQQNEIEDVKNTLYIEIDDICCKEQKSSRKEEIGYEQEQREKHKRKQARAKGKKPYKESKYLFQTVCYLSKSGQRFSIVTGRNDRILPKYPVLIKSFIKSTGLQNDNLIFLTDGAKSLQKEIKSAFRGNQVKQILDWYHLSKKVSSQLMMGMKISEKREEKETQIKQYLWYGLTEQAIMSIESIITKDVKNKKALETLIGYIERQKNMIPNYDLRKRLNLKNSSSRVEKENDIFIAQRQKRNGMSWSKRGSNALAIIQMMKMNNQIKSFYSNGIFKFDWAA